MSLEILVQDRHFVVVAKPAGIGVGSDDSQDRTLLQMVREWYQTTVNPGGKGYCVPIHFLDRPVSGAVVFALSSKAAARLNDQFRKRRVQKTYLAVVRGRPEHDTQELRHFLAKDRERNKTKVVSPSAPDGKESILSYRVLRQEDDHCYVAVKPKTGRSHQIRVQLASLGTPIIGDRKYGDREEWHQRIALHAIELDFEHPTEKTRVRVHAPPPLEWAQRFPSTASLAWDE